MKITMDIKRIREESIHQAKRLGANVPATLPLFDEGLETRSADETISRILAMHAVAASAYGFDKAKAVSWLKQESLVDSLGKAERCFLLEGTGQPDQFANQIEGMWALTWAKGIANELNFAKNCDNRFVTILPNLKQNQSSTDFRKKANPRPVEQIAANCDLAYCLHWAIREAGLSGQRPPGNLDPNIVVERRRAFEWLLSKEAWDEISLDT